MGSGRRHDDAPRASAMAPRGRRPSDQGLRALGDQVGGGAGRRDGVANERGLRALGSEIDHAHGGRRPKAAAGAGGGGRRGGGTGRGGTGGGVGPGRRPRRRWSRRRKILTPLVAVLALALVVVGGAYGYARYRYDQIRKVTVAAEHPATAGQPFNMLVIGSDTRAGAKVTTGIGTVTTVGGQRSDVIMVWHVVPATKKITILSIPRDTLVQMEGANVTQFGRFNRINSAYNSGPDLLVQTIQDNLGIPINHVVQVDFSGFQGAVNALGGVSMDFRYPARDTYSGLDITATGCQLLNGSQALAVARSRHYQYEVTGQWQDTPLGDLGRIQRQDAFLKALVDSAKSKYNPLTLNAFVGSLPQGIEIDKTFSLGDLVSLAAEFHSLTPNSIATYTLPTTTVGFVTPWGDVLFVSQPQDQELLVQIFGSGLTAPTTPPPDTTLVPAAPPVVSAAPATGTASAPATAGAGTAAPAGTASSTTTSAPASSTTTPSFDPTPCTS